MYIIIYTKFNSQLCPIFIYVLVLPVQSLPNLHEQINDLSEYAPNIQLHGFLFIYFINQKATFKFSFKTLLWRHYYVWKSLETDRRCVCGASGKDSFPVGATGSVSVGRPQTPWGTGATLWSGSQPNLSGTGTPSVRDHSSVEPTDQPVTDREGCSLMLYLHTPPS